MGMKDRIRRLEGRFGDGAPVRFTILKHGEERPEGEEEPWLEFTLDLGPVPAGADELLLLREDDERREENDDRRR